MEKINPDKPCPFCGGDIITIQYSELKEAYRIDCISCMVGFDFYSCKEKQDAIAAWNKRGDIRDDIIARAEKREKEIAERAEKYVSLLQYLPEKMGTRLTRDVTGYELTTISNWAKNGKLKAEKEDDGKRGRWLFNKKDIIEIAMQNKYYIAKNNRDYERVIYYLLRLQRESKITEIA